MTADRPLVLLADDHPPVRAGIRESLEVGGFLVCGEAADATDAVDQALRFRPDVALLDIHMPGSGIRAAGEISRALPQTAVVMLTFSRDDDDLFDSLRAGASGYLLKDTNPAELPIALHRVLSGEAAVSGPVVKRILDEFRAPARRRFVRRSPAAAKLSSREWEVMQLLAEGQTTAEVAQRLFVSSATVRVHVSAVLRKLRVKDRQGAFDVLGDQ